MDTAAPAAPAGASATGPTTPAAQPGSTNGAGPASVAAPVTPSPAPAGQHRGPDGKFASPKPPAPEAPFFDDELELDGRKERYTFKSREELARHLQRTHGVESKAAREIRQAREEREQVRRMLELGKADPEALLRELGHDPQEFAIRRALEAARVEAMSEVERRAYELEQENTTLKAKWEELQKQQESAQHEAQREAMKQQNLKAFSEALEAGNLPRTHETLYLLTETQELRLRANLPPYSPVELAEATEKRLVKQTQSIYGGLAKQALADPSGPAAKALLQRLGKDVERAVLQASVAAFQASQSFGQPPPAPPAPPPAPTQAAGIDEDEAERRLRALRGKR